MKENIAVIERGNPVLKNNVGCKWAPCKTDDGWGFGALYFNGQKLGGEVPWFLKEESTCEEYHADSFEILENSPSRGSIRFAGKDGKLDFTVTVTLEENSYSYSIDFTFDPIHPVYHPLYLDIPYSSESSRFVKFPYETTVLPGRTERWSIKPDHSRAPLLFGEMNLGTENCFVGLGYRLDQNFTEGRLEYDPNDHTERAFRIYSLFNGMARPIDFQCVTKLELARSECAKGYQRAHKMGIIVSTASTQFDCIRSYIAQSGYDDHVEFSHSIKQSVEAIFSLYKNAPGYVPGKGYHQLIRFDTGDFDSTVPHGWYSKYLVTGPQLLLAEQLYKHWVKRPGEEWARTRAFEMADFTLSMQEECGAFTNWDTDMEDVSIMHPNDVEGTEFNRCIYSISDMGIGLVHWVELYRDVQKVEGIDREDWKQGILKAAHFMASLVGNDGELGRNYDLNGNCDKLTSDISEALLAFDCVSNEFGIPELARVRDQVEAWAYENYIHQNNWCNGSVDGGAWQGAGWPPPHNNDLMGVFNYATYCVNRYQKENDAGYLQKAKDAVAYIWTSVMPVQSESCTLPTRTLVREQDFYSIYGVLIRGNDSIESLPYLSKVTQDPFFMKFYQLIVQVQIAYQAFEQPYAGFHIGLECDMSGREPVNTFAEGNNGYITRFVPQFLRSVTDQYAYQYVGGRGWGLGADYHLTFDLDSGDQTPYVCSASTMVRNIAWDQQKRVFSVYLYDTEHSEGVLEIHWPRGSANAVRIRDGETMEETCIEIDKNSKICIPYKHERPSKVIYVG